MVQSGCSFKIELKGLAPLDVGYEKKIKHSLLTRGRSHENEASGDEVGCEVEEGR